jgi:hypothetical protein
MTDASRQALAILRDPSLLQWYVIPLLALAFYVYGVEVERKNWNGVLAGLAFWAMDWLNEIANGLVLHFTQRSAIWTAPGRTAYLLLVGLNVEISFMFLLAGVIGVKFLPADRRLRILGLPNRFVIALGFSVFCVAVEVLLNRAHLLVWEYRWWNYPNVWLIVPFGYLHFYLVAYAVHDMERMSTKLITVGALYAAVIAGLAVFGAGLHWI